MSGENTVSSDEKAPGAGFWAVMTTISPACQMSEHDACDEMTADFLADHPEAAPWDCRCICHIGRYLTERDRARSTAVALEQELARRDQALDEIRALHTADIVDVTTGAMFCAHSRLDEPCEVARILSDLAASLDAQLNKEDDSE